MTAVAVVVIALLGVSAWYRQEYGAWVGSPQRFNFCDRRYYLQGEQITWTQAKAEAAKSSLRGETPYPLAKVTTLLGRPMYGPVGQDGAYLTVDTFCPLTLYRKIGADSYQPYHYGGGDLPAPGQH